MDNAHTYLNSISELTLSRTLQNYQKTPSDASGGEVGAAIVCMHVTIVKTPT